jgi:hypothetical protein
MNMIKKYDIKLINPQKNGCNTHEKVSIPLAPTSLTQLPNC